MEVNHLYTYFEKHHRQILDDIKKVVECDSPTNQKDLVDLCGLEIQKLFQSYFGYEAEVIENQERGNHLRFEYGGGDETILILSHFDTVWDKDKLAYKEEGDLAYGPGILDMKSGLTFAIWSLKALKELGISLNKKIVFLCTSDEEVGSQTSQKIIEEEAKKSTYVLVTEPAEAGTNALKTERKGTGRYTVKITGKAAHSGNNHEDGINAIEEAAQQIAYIQSLTNYTRGTTFNVGAIEGGGPLNVVPDSVKFGVDVRMKTEEEQKSANQKMFNLKSKLAGSKIVVEGGINRPPMAKTDGTEQLVKMTQKIGQKLGLDLKETTVGGGSDGNFTAALGIPTIDGLGATGLGIHALNEQINASDIPVRAALLAGMIHEL